MELLLYRILAGSCLGGGGLTIMALPDIFYYLELGPFGGKYFTFGLSC
jgi:hypothetical protein